MDTTEIQRRVDAMAETMERKGVRVPTLRATIVSGISANDVYIAWNDQIEWKTFINADISACLRDAEEYVDHMPDATQFARSEYQIAVEHAIASGRLGGIDVSALEQIAAGGKHASVEDQDI